MNKLSFNQDFEDNYSSKQDKRSQKTIAVCVILLLLIGLIVCLFIFKNSGKSIDTPQTDAFYQETELFPVSEEETVVTEIPVETVETVKEEPIEASAPVVVPSVLPTVSLPEIQEETVPENETRTTNGMVILDLDLVKNFKKENKSR